MTSSRREVIYRPRPATCDLTGVRWALEGWSVRVPINSSVCLALVLEFPT